VAPGTSGGVQDLDLLDPPRLRLAPRLHPRALRRRRWEASSCRGRGGDFA
jgi:hypothetical protein